MSAFSEWLAKRVAGRPAAFAGDPELAAQPRLFGYLFLETSHDSAGGASGSATELGGSDVDLVELVPYTLDLSGCRSRRRRPSPGSSRPA